MRLIGLTAVGATGHGPVRLLLLSAVSLGFFWNEGPWG